MTLEMRLAAMAATLLAGKYRDKGALSINKEDIKDALTVAHAIWEAAVVVENYRND